MLLLTPRASVVRSQPAPVGARGLPVSSLAARAHANYRLAWTPLVGAPLTVQQPRQPNGNHAPASVAQLYLYVNIDSCSEAVNPCGYFSACERIAVRLCRVWTGQACDTRTQDFRRPMLVRRKKSVRGIPATRRGRTGTGERRRCLGEQERGARVGAWPCVRGSSTIRSSPRITNDQIGGVELSAALEENICYGGGRQGSGAGY